MCDINRMPALSPGMWRTTRLSARPFLTRDPLDRNRQVRDFGLHDVDHAIDRRAVEGGTFGDNPAPNTVEHRAEIKGRNLKHDA